MTNTEQGSDLEDICDLLLVTGREESGTCYFLIASPDRRRLLSALEYIPSEIRGNIENPENETSQDDAEWKIYTFYKLTNTDISPYLSQIEGIASNDLGTVRNKRQFRIYAGTAINEYFAKYFKSNVKRKLETTVGEFEQNPLLTDLIYASADLITAHQVGDRQSWLSARSTLASLTPSPLYSRIEEIVRLAQQEGKNRERLIGLQCGIIDAVVRGDYKFAAQLKMTYEQTPLK